MFNDAPNITDDEFHQFRDLIYRIAGIKLADTKKVLLVGRLARRLRHHQLRSFGDYFRLVSAPGQTQELQTMVDLLTTNETYFFREPAHFEFLSRELLANHPPSRGFDVWSAASSTGEEVYTLAMVLAEKLGMGGSWSVTGSDISTSVLATAQRGAYVLERTRGLADEYRRKYCQPCPGDPDSFEIKPELKRRTRFMQVNLNRGLPPMNRYHLIFVRNVMIYFDNDTKRQVVERLVSRLHPGGHLIVGHSESLSGLNDMLRQVRPTIYRLPDPGEARGVL